MAGAIVKIDRLALALAAKEADYEDFCQKIKITAYYRRKIENGERLPINLIIKISKFLELPEQEFNKIFQWSERRTNECFL